MWSFDLVSHAIDSTRECSSSGKRKRREYVPPNAPKYKKQKEYQKEKDFVVIKDLKSLVVKGQLVVAEQELKEFDDESNLLEIIDSAYGIRKIINMWLTSIDVDKIEDFLIYHLVQNNIKVEDVSDVLSKFLFEIVKEKQIEQPINVEYLEKEGNDIHSMLEKCNDA